MCVLCSKEGRGEGEVGGGSSQESGGDVRSERGVGGGGGEERGEVGERRGWVVVQVCLASSYECVHLNHRWEWEGGRWEWEGVWEWGGGGSVWEGEKCGVGDSVNRR